MQLSFICVLIIAALCTCNSENSTPVTVPADTHAESNNSARPEVVQPSDTINVPEIFTDALTSIFERYEKIGIELSEENEEEAAHLSEYLTKMVKNLPLPLRPRESMVDTIKRYMSNAASKIGEKEGLDIQRAQFALMTQQLLTLLKIFPIKTGDLFVYHCPGTTNEKWDWITTSPKPINPYSNSDCGSAIILIKGMDVEE